MDKLASANVVGLFGRLDHHVELRSKERVTILTGVNGTGKTHVLRLISAAHSLDFARLATMPFEVIVLRYRSGKEFQIHRLHAGVYSFRLYGRLTRRKPMRDAYVTSVGPEVEGRVPPTWSQISEGLWRDSSDGEVIEEDEFRERFRLFEGDIAYRVVYEDASDGGWVNSMNLPKTILIDTDRLDRPKPSMRLSGRRAAASRARLPSSRIEIYIDEIRKEVTDARRRSLTVSQRADRDFASRALQKTSGALNEGAIREEYERLSSLSQRLYENGLTEESAGVSLPEGRMGAVEKRILNVFLDDWRKKLEPLLPVHEKLRTLREIFGSKFLGKKVSFSNSGDLIFRGVDGEVIAVESLSSGEQHLVALFTMLLFYSEPGGVVLIDEPEISLHAAWQHAFLSDLQGVAEVSDLQLLVATHSTSIINSQWDLVEEISV